MKILAIVCTFCLVLVSAEPPVNGQNGYPSSNALQTPNNGYLPPSTSYGVPSNSNHQYQPRPSNSYLPPNGHGSNGHGSNGHGSNGHGSNGHGNNGYHASQASFQAPSQQYGAPSQQYGAPSQQYGAPSQQYGAPAVTGAVFKPSSTYGAPNGHSNGGNGYSNGGNGYSNGGNGYGNGGGYEYNEPAKYSFEYQVLDYPSGNDFGHMESRDGDRTVGRYYVLLPDGRKQVVTYEADEKGYRPTITYEDTGNGNNGGNYAASNGYNNNGQFQGY